jgi:type III secretory pathway component EscV
MDVNIMQQKTPRIYQVPQNLKRSVEDLTSDIDAGVETILTYDNLNIDSVNVLLTPAPLVIPELREEFNNLWSEALRIIGISNVSIQKKERLIRDEMSALNGGTIASRFSRWEPRKKAIEEINEKFADYLEKPIEVEFYDKTPDSETADNNDNLELDLTSVGGGQNVL